MSGRRSGGRLTATYLAELPADRAQAAAEGFATGQSIGTWLPVPGITAEMRRVQADFHTLVARATPEDLRRVAATLNQRPRPTLNLQTPADRLNQLLLAA